MDYTSGLDFIGNNATNEMRLGGSKSGHELIKLLLGIPSGVW